EDEELDQFRRQSNGENPENQRTYAQPERIPEALRQIPSLPNHPEQRDNGTGKEPDREDQQNEEEVEFPEDEENDTCTRHHTPLDDVLDCILPPVPLLDALNNREDTEEENQGGQDYGEE